MLAILLSLLAISVCILGHAQTPEEMRTELQLRNRITIHSKRSLDKCSTSPAAVALNERAIARRAAKAEALSANRGVKAKKQRRDEVAFERYLNVSHDMADKGFDRDTPLSAIFDSNTTCALVPETVIGPYYVEGELIRPDITDGQPGIFSHLDIQFIDINTCEPLSNLLIDVWHCNATGIYSGVAAEGQGGLQTTFGRGVQQTDSEGVVQFDTIFPGHYTGRATHIHILSTANATVLSNGTFTGGSARHIGQAYFDTSLREAVEVHEPYVFNTQDVTSNAEDRFAPDEATDEYDPFMNYIQLGEDVSDGLLLWIAIGIDTTADYSDKVTPAATYDPNGDAI